ncbi:hypothetical protein FRACYDRAFT_246951 [Fragilariopsis cylindrus CCMP1102]|uniref:JmjC domain-containing protein n=1 Tax=Fragilariopsis cylindrus CCMP1102 TaxID=635003 RepID=A0A1E7EXB1_9STRA|nr:hypothetical protein FRACYDRAFT_246951 [Fragilariopsis cylindrus CCMP1102]|eukprot:OEU10486.1 hypothetical protein FRACYDRAFT_246951 [Fragilariopsis cylindrus CCMP1102]
MVKSKSNNRSKSGGSSNISSSSSCSFGNSNRNGGGGISRTSSRRSSSSSIRRGSSSGSGSGSGKRRRARRINTNNWDGWKPIIQSSSSASLIGPATAVPSRSTVVATIWTVGVKSVLQHIKNNSDQWDCKLAKKNGSIDFNSFEAFHYEYLQNNVAYGQLYYGKQTTENILMDAGLMTMSNMNNNNSPTATASTKSSSSFIIPKGASIKSMDRSLIIFLSNDIFSLSGTHRDGTHSILYVLSGTKSIYLAPPTDTDLEYEKNEYNPFQHQEEFVVDSKPNSNSFSNSNSSSSASCWNWKRVDLIPGESLYIPKGWWHNVYSTSNTVAFSIDISIDAFHLDRNAASEINLCNTMIEVEGLEYETSLYGICPGIFSIIDNATTITSPLRTATATTDDSSAAGGLTTTTTEQQLQHQQQHQHPVGEQQQQEPPLSPTPPPGALGGEEYDDEEEEKLQSSLSSSSPSTLPKYPPQADQEGSVSLTATATADDSNATGGPTTTTTTTERQQEQEQEHQYPAEEQPPLSPTPSPGALGGGEYDDEEEELQLLLSSSSSLSSTLPKYPLQVVPAAAITPPTEVSQSPNAKIVAAGEEEENFSFNITKTIIAFDNSNSKSNRGGRR